MTIVYYISMYAAVCIYKSFAKYQNLVCPKLINSLNMSNMTPNSMHQDQVCYKHSNVHTKIYDHVALHHYQ